MRRFTKKFLIFCNLFISLFFIAGAFSAHFDPVTFWFTGLLTLALPYLLFLLIVFFIVWLLSKKIWMIISLLSIIICWKAVTNVFPLNFSSSFKIEKQPGSIRIMSWNVEHFDILEHKQHPETKQKMLDLINQYQPDIACFQEMVAGEDDKAINYLGDFKKILGFSGYYYSYDNRLNFDAHHHFGIITFSKFPIVAQKTIVSYPNDYNSTFQHVDVMTGNDTVRVFNIHLQSLKFTQTNLNYLDNPGADSAITESKNIISKLKRGFIRRAAQAQVVKKELTESPYSTLICGDFNDVPNSFAYETIGAGFQNAFVKRGTGFGRTFSGISPTLRIDNIFADNSFYIQQFTRIPKKLSDHFPIIVDVRLLPKN